jgi:hypothetical protein
MGNGRLEDDSVVKPHMLFKNSALGLRESNGPVELEPSQNCVFRSKIQPALLITKSPLRLGIIANRKSKPISVKNHMAVVLEDCE